ncbi:MAG: Gfo/Idh/MocA family oxidoreductase, partial [Chloroflexota bacterium]|nr:Gfo/Idh/MocA family oxidoreductase [Chloroflexota bacterium]
MLRLALLGAGRIGQVHARSITEHGEAQLAWVCDPIEEAATTLAGAYGAKWSPEPQDALDDPGVDAVLIASATATHTDLIRRSVLAGKKVLCEKPIDLDMARIDACWNDIADHAPFVMLGFKRRFDPTFREVRERVATGEIGPISPAFTLALTSAKDGSKRRLKPSITNGALSLIASHVASIFAMSRSIGFSHRTFLPAS